MRVLCLAIACLLTINIGPSWAQEDFGRLFTTAQQRQYLDSLRDQNFVSSDQVLKEEYKKSLEEDLPGNQDTKADQVNKVTLSGYVLRGDGKYTVWVNGKSATGSENFGVYHGKPNARSQRVGLRKGDRYSLMKPGQVWKLDTGEIKERYQVKTALPTDRDTRQNDAIADSPSISPEGDLSGADNLPSGQAELVDKARNVRQVYEKTQEIELKKK